MPSVSLENEALVSWRPLATSTVLCSVVSLLMPVWSQGWFRGCKRCPNRGSRRGNLQDVKKEKGKIPLLRLFLLRCSLLYAVFSVTLLTLNVLSGISEETNPSNSTSPVQIQGSDVSFHNNVVYLLIASHIPQPQRKFIGTAFHTNVSVMLEKDVYGAGARSRIQNVKVSAK